MSTMIGLRGSAAFGGRLGRLHSDGRHAHDVISRTFLNRHEPAALDVGASDQWRSSRGRVDLRHAHHRTGDRPRRPGDVAGEYVALEVLGFRGRKCRAEHNGRTRY
jgi:hypothetical protein